MLKKGTIVVVGLLLAACTARPGSDTPHVIAGTHRDRDMAREVWCVNSARGFDEQVETLKLAAQLRISDGAADRLLKRAADDWEESEFSCRKPTQ